MFTLCLIVVYPTAFFDGLAGADADIDAVSSNEATHTLLLIAIRQVFEIEEDFDTALDTHEYGHAPFVDAFHQRRSSQRSHGHLSNRRPSSHDHDRAGSTSHPPHLGRRDPSPVPTSPRQRLHSAVNRGVEMAHTFTSPLAQIFQPLIVDEEMPEDAEPSSSLQIPGGISYGPATRRKLSQMQRSPAADSAISLAHRFPTMGNHKGTDEDVHFSSSPEVDVTHKEPETAEEVQEEEFATGAVTQWAKRLETLEQGQKRIEDLLDQLLKSTREEK